MEVLELNGVNYVKASSIARDLGYTSDYVGQLCRSGKVDAQLVGRSWYVSDESIRSHKQARYRSTKAKSVNALKRTLRAESESEDTSVPIRKKLTPIAKNKVSTSSQHFYKKLKPAEAKYTEDQSELIPTLTERKTNTPATKLDVELADAKKLSIKDSKKPYKMGATALPKIKFTGNVTIVEPVEGVIEASEKTTTESGEDSVIESRMTFVERLEGMDSKPSKQTILTPNIKEFSNKLEVADEGGVSTKKVPLRRPGVVSMTRDTPSLGSTTAELVVTQTTDKIPTSGRAVFAYISTSAFLAVILGGAIILLENSVTTVAGTTTVNSSYNFNLSLAIEAILNLKI